MENVIFRRIERALEHHFLEPEVIENGSGIEKIEKISSDSYLKMRYDHENHFCSAYISCGVNDSVKGDDVFSSENANLISIAVGSDIFMCVSTADGSTNVAYELGSDDSVTILELVEDSFGAYSLDSMNDDLNGYYLNLSDDYDKVGETSVTAVVDSLKSGDFENFFSKNFKSGLKK